MKMLIIICVTWMLHAEEPALTQQFYDAIRSDNRAAVAKLIAEGSDINARDGRGNTPLMYAAAVGSPAMMGDLISAGADVKAKNSFDSTALMWCTSDFEKVRLLVDKGADVNVLTKRGSSPLSLAAATTAI